MRMQATSAAGRPPAGACVRASDRRARERTPVADQVHENGSGHFDRVSIMNNQRGRQMTDSLKNVLSFWPQIDSGI